jgi:mono/diheme cytochrome c family protein
LPLVLGLLPACQQKMAVQPSYRPDDASSFFADGRAARPLVAGTVARGHLRTDLPLFTGKRGPDDPGWALPASLVGAVGWSALGATAATLDESNYVEQVPLAVTEQMLQHGRIRYMIYCVVCHDPLGTGRGKIVERGYTPPPSYHIDRLRHAPVGHIFDVITRGYGSMPAYGPQIPPRDRWAIVAYLRALQLSQHFPVKDLSPEMRGEMEKAQGAGRQLP